MRCGPFLVMLALLLGAAPAPAQDSPGIIPMPKQPAPKPAKKHIRHKATAVNRPKPPKPSRPQTKPAKAKPAAKLPQARPAEAKAVVPKPRRQSPPKPKPTKTRSKPAKPDSDAKPEAAKPSRRPTRSPAFRRASARKSRRRCCGRATIPARPAATIRCSTAIKNFQKRQQGQGHRRADAVRARRLWSPPPRRTRTNSAGAWWSIRQPACASACRPSWCRMRATPRAARAGRRRTARCRSRPSASRQPDLKLAALFEQREEGAGDAQDRDQRAARRQFLHQRHAGPEDVFRARQAARRRGARLHHAVRPDDGRPSSRR